MCRCLELSKSAYYKWLSERDERQERKNRPIVETVKEIHEDSRQTYGSPRVFQKLKSMGVQISLNTVARIMQKNSLRAKTKKKFKVTTDSKHNLAVAPNLLDRNFSPELLNTAWCGDITYIWTDEGWLYLATVIELKSKKVIGWSMNKRMKKSIVIDALDMAISARSFNGGLIFHSDRGSQYCSNDFKKLLTKNRIIQSMSRKGNCWDNAVAESFFATIKKDLIFHENFNTRNEARKKIFEWIEYFYNQFRSHSSLGYKSPVDYELDVA